jgi:nitronate monooxygenase
MGTAFLATPEAVEVHDIHKELIVASDGGDTVFTRAYDIVSGLPWPGAIGERVRRNAFTEEWADREGELRGRREEVAAAEPRQFDGPPDPERGAVLYGQSAGFVDSIRPAGVVLARVCNEAEAILGERPRSLLS